jgi:hypothetical protein
MNIPELIEISLLNKWDQLRFGVRCTHLVQHLVDHENQISASEWLEYAEMTAYSEALKGYWEEPSELNLKEDNSSSAKAFKAAWLCFRAATSWKMPRPDIIFEIVQLVAESDPNCVDIIWKKFELMSEETTNNAEKIPYATIALTVLGEPEEFVLRGLTKIT